MPETTAKESRVKLTLCGFTYNVYPDLKWTADLSRFFKAPPGVSVQFLFIYLCSPHSITMQAFESVIPSERTRVAIKIIDGSIRCLAPSHPGAIVLYVDELDFATNIVGDSPEMSFHLLIPAISLLLVDDLLALNESAAMKQPRTHSASGGIMHWKVRFVGGLVHLIMMDIHRD